MNKAIKILDRIISTILIALVAFLAVGVTVTIGLLIVRDTVKA